MRRTLVFACLCALALPAAQARTLEQIKGGALRICVAGSSADFYRANAEAFARFLGAKAEVKRLLDWDQQFQNRDGVVERDAAYESRLLAESSCDLFPNDLHVLDWRESKMLMVPYYTARKVVIAHQDLRGALASPQDLAGRTAVVQKGTAYEAWLLQQNASAFSARPVEIRYAPTAECMKLVSERAADFTVAGTEGAFKWVRTELRNLVILFPVDAPVRVGWGLSPGAKDLAAELRRFFDENRRVGSDLDRSWQKEYGVSLVEYELRYATAPAPQAAERGLPGWAAPAAACALLALCAAVAWGWRLRRGLARESSMREIFENMSSGIILRDRDFVLLDANRAFLEFVGYSREEIEALPAFSLAHPDLREDIARQFARLRAGEIVQYRAQQRFLHKSGKLRAADVVVSAVRDRKGAFAGTMAIVTEAPDEGADSPGRTQAERT